MEYPFLLLFFDNHSAVESKVTNQVGLSCGFDMKTISFGLFRNSLFFLLG